MEKRYLILLFLGFVSLASAQINEFGVFIGGSNYIGDVGPTTYIRPNAPAFGLIYKYNKNPRVAYRTTLTNLTINAKDSSADDPIRESFGNAINKQITELTAGIEFNFSEYNLANRKYTKTFYLILELAAFQYKAAISRGPSVAPEVSLNYAKKRGLAIPFGIGYKAKLYRNFAFAIETRFRYTLVDDLDDGAFIKQQVLPTTHPNYAKFNNPATNDWYVFTGVSVVYTFGRPPCYSNSRH